MKKKGEELPSLKKVRKCHDEYFKISLSDPKIAKEFLENYLPKEVREITNLEKIHIAKVSFIEKDLKSNYVDILFKAQIKEQVGYIYLLCEHVRHEVAHIKSVTYG